MKKFEFYKLILFVTEPAVDLALLNLARVSFFNKAESYISNTFILALIAPYSSLLF
jgi:hypothetical protein